MLSQQAETAPQMLHSHLPKGLILWSVFAARDVGVQLQQSLSEPGGHSSCFSTFITTNRKRPNDFKLSQC